MTATTIPLRLTPYQAKLLWGILDGAADAGACTDGLTEREGNSLHAITMKLNRHHPKWKDAK